MGIEFIQLEMDLDGFKKNENKKKSGDEQEITEQVYMTNSPKCIDQDCNDKDELGKLSCDLCSYKCKTSITLKKHMTSTHGDHKCSNGELNFKTLNEVIRNKEQYHSSTNKKGKCQKT